MKKKLCLAIAFLVVSEFNLSAQDWTPSRVDRFGETGFLWTPLATAVDISGKMYVGVQVQSVTALENISLRLIEVDKDGKKTGDVEIAGIEQGVPSIDDIEITPNGEILVSVFSGKAIVKRFNPRLEEVGDINISQIRGKCRIAKILSDRNGFYLIGNVEKEEFEEIVTDALVARFDQGGHLMWSKAHDDSKYDFFEDGVIVNDRLTVIGNQGANKILYFDNPKVWLAALDTNGDIISEKVFPGKLMDFICQQGVLEVLFDKRQKNDDLLEIFVKSLTPDFNEIAEQFVTQSSFDLPVMWRFRKINDSYFIYGFTKQTWFGVLKDGGAVVQYENSLMRDSIPVSAEVIDGKLRLIAAIPHEENGIFGLDVGVINPVVD